MTGFGMVPSFPTVSTPSPEVFDDRVVARRSGPNGPRPELARKQELGETSRDRPNPFSKPPLSRRSALSFPGSSKARNLDVPEAPPPTTAKTLLWGYFLMMTSRTHLHIGGTNTKAQRCWCGNKLCPNELEKIVCADCLTKQITASR